MFNHFYLVELDKAKASPRNSAYNTPNSSQLTSPAVSRRSSLELLISKEYKLNIVKPKYIRLSD